MVRVGTTFPNPFGREFQASEEDGSCWHIPRRASHDDDVGDEGAGSGAGYGVLGPGSAQTKEEPPVWLCVSRNPQLASAVASLVAKAKATGAR